MPSSILLHFVVATEPFGVNFISDEKLGVPPTVHTPSFLFMFFCDQAKRSKKGQKEELLEFIDKYDFSDLKVRQQLRANSRKADMPYLTDRTWDAAGGCFSKYARDRHCGGGQTIRTCLSSL